MQSTTMLGLAMIALVWAGIIFHLNIAYRNELQSAKQETANLARAFEEHITRMIRGIDATILVLRTMYERDNKSFEFIDWTNAGIMSDVRLYPIRYINDAGSSNPILFARALEVAAIVRPHKSVSIRSEAHALRLSDRYDLWYSGGGAFQPWTFGYAGRPSGGYGDLAALYDVSADYALNAHWTVTGYFGHVSGGEVVRSLYPSDARANFGYVELNYKF